MAEKKASIEENINTKLRDKKEGWTESVEVYAEVNCHSHIVSYIINSSC